VKGESWNTYIPAPSPELMKIALMTYFSVDNTGQFFQALASIQALKKTYPDSQIELVNLHHERKPTWLPPRSLPNVIPFLLRHWKYASARSKSFSSYLGSQRLNRPSAKEITAYLNDGGYDVVITGADTCLKVDKHWGGELPPYWLPGDVKARKFIISGSAENTVPDDLSSKQMEAARKCINGLSGMYARDTMTRDLLSKIVPEKAAQVQLVGDPTFSLSLPLADIKNLKARLGGSDKPLCAVNLPKSPIGAAIIGELSKDFQVFSINRPSQAGEPALFLGPWDWLAMWNSVQALVTTSFHETIFAMRSGVPLVSVDIDRDRAGRSGARSKSGDLLALAGLDSLHWSVPEIDRASGIVEALKLSKAMVTGPSVVDHCRVQSYSYLKAIQSIGQSRD